MSQLLLKYSLEMFTDTSKTVKEKLCGIKNSKIKFLEVNGPKGGLFVFEVSD